MSIQQQLNKALFNYLPTIKSLLKNVTIWEANQIEQITINKAINHYKPISECNYLEIKYFENDLVDIFTYRKLI